jgi:LGFP repeat
VHGLIRARWAAMGWENSRLGFPTADEAPTFDKVGRFSSFEGGVITWSPATGAHEVYGAILDKYRQLGMERSFLGYPTSGEMDLSVPGGGRCSNFQRGQIAWSPSSGANVSSTSYDPATGGRGPGGVRLTGLPSSGVPEVRRRLVCRASMHIKDDESIWDGGGIPDFGRAKGREERLVTSDLALDVLKLKGTAGGEVRVELVVNAQVRLSGDVLVKARAVLYEGSSTHSGDRDGDEELTVLVPRDGVHEGSFRVDNEDEGGDFGSIALEIQNHAA